MLLISFFTQEQILPLYVGGIFIILSVFLYKKFFFWSCSTLGLGILSISYFAGMLDPFLNIWDERFHALVAKNTTNNFLHPKLFKEHFLPYNYKIWIGNSTWLHKQPLFIWQMALSIKMFGANVFAVRFPSILMHALISFFIYRIGFNLRNKRTGFISALFFGVAFFPLELVSGFYASDHNDAAFIFYITASFWSYVEYERTKNKKWLILIGLFSGCAILVKWLVGLLVFFPWVISIIISILKKEEKLKIVFPMLLSLGICVLVFLPWQFYIHYKFPLEALYEAEYNVMHFTEAIEGHQGLWYYYFDEGLKLMYGSADLIPYFLLLSIILLTIKLKNRNQKIFLISTISVVYIFYSFAATKMVAFVAIVSPLIFIAIANLFDTILTWTGKKLKRTWIENGLFIIITLTVSYSFINLSKIEVNHTFKKYPKNTFRSKMLDEMKVNMEVKERLGTDKFVVFYGKDLFENISMMFFTDYIVYNEIPSEEDIELVLEKDYIPVIIDSPEIPAEIRSNSKCRIIKLSQL